MEQLRIPKLFILLVCALMVFGISGCGSNDDNGPPADISGTWAAVFTTTGETPMNETWTIMQNGQQVSGNYTFGVNTWAYNGTYVNGAFAAVDGDGWILQFSFEGNTGTGTISGDGEVWNAILTR